MKRILVALLLIAIAAAGGWYWWSHRDTGDSGELALHGNVDIRQISLAFDGNGRIAELRAEEGDSVKAGQIMGLLDTSTLELQARQADAQVDAQKQALLRLRNGSRPEEIAQARAQLASAEASAVLAEQNLSRATRLRSSGTASGQSLDQAQSEAEAARANVEQLRAALQLAEAGARAEDIHGAEAQLAAAEANLALLHHQIDQGQLRAPVDAVVRSRLREPGDMTTAATPVFALALTDPKWIRVYASEPDLGRIRPGMPARVFTDSRPNQPVTGQVGYISSVAEFTPKSVQTEELRTSLVYEVRVVVEDEEDALRLGQPVTVRLTTGATQ
jgi:HlyD family secretion protein